MERLTLEEIKIRLYKKNKNINILDNEYINCSQEMKCECLIHNNIWNMTWTQLNCGYGCPICAKENKIKTRRKNAIKNKKSFADVYPHLIKYFKYKEDAYKYSYGSKEKVIVKCDICGREKEMIIKNIPKNNICSLCNDFIPYTEKFMFNVLEQLGIKFDFHKKFIWSKRKEYDFYLNNYNILIETHGLQHYENSFISIKGAKTLEEEQENDKLKKELALSNNIKKENYVVIDCRYSQLEWIKNNILESRLAELFDLSNIDWNKVGEYACSNLVITICNLYNSKQISNSEFIKFIQSKFKISYKTVLKYLKSGTESKICTYNSIDSYKNNWRSKKIICLNNMKIYESVSYLNNIFFKEFGIISTVSGISYSCRNKKEYKNLTFLYLDDYNKEELK